jgi:hypothetical protein
MLLTVPVSLPGAMASAIANELLLSANQQEGESTSFRLRSAGGRDSIDMRVGGLSVRVAPEAGERQLMIDSTTRSTEATQVVARDAQVRISASNEQISPISVRADNLRLSLRLEGDEHVLLGLIAEGNVRMTFGDADARCANATISVRTSSSTEQKAPSHQEYAELKLDHDVDISRVREKDRVFLAGEHARIHLGGNGFSLQLSSVPLSQPLPSDGGSENESTR